jgi:diguanylate cyclase (GGDEF)-like protein
MDKLAMHNAAHYRQPSSWLGALLTSADTGNSSSTSYFFQLFFLTLLYFLGGILGLSIESSHTGVTPIWPASGIAFAAFFYFGIRLWPAIYIAMLMLAWYTGLPYEVALIAATGSTLEAAFPVFILRRVNFKGDFNNINNVLLFIAIAMFLAPVFSATSGVLAFNLTTSLSIEETTRVWLYWWLGNGIGLLIVGAFLIVWRSTPCVGRPGEIVRKTSLAVFIAAGCFLSLLFGNSPVSTLILFLLPPVAILGAIRYGQHCATLLGLTALMSFLITGGLLLPEQFKLLQLSTLYLNIAFLAIFTSTTLIVSAAYAEQSGKRELEYQAHYDSLTGLMNRIQFMQELESTLSSKRGRDEKNCLLYLDLDGLKTVNDTAGHSAGDEVLQVVGKVIDQQVRSLDNAARLGGDEFAILVKDCSLNGAGVIAEKLRVAIAEQKIHWREQIHQVTASIGLTEIERDRDYAPDVIERADMACYTAKRAGGDRIEIASTEVDKQG